MTPADLEFLQRHMVDTGRVELRALYPSGQAMSGLFDDIPKFIDAIHALRQEANCYYTTQAPRLMSVPNRIGTRSLRNDDIASFARIVFDLDTVREGRPASDDEMESAFDLGADLRKFLYREGWPMPVWIHSGNGLHLIYRTPPIPNSPEFNAMLRTIYGGLHREFSNPTVTFDRSVRNAGRIMRCPGSYNLKYPTGDLLMCVVRDCPKHWQQVKLSQIESIARLFHVDKPKRQLIQSRGPKISGTGNYATLDVVSWFQAHSHYVGHLRDNVHGVRCPWVEEHTSTSPDTGSDSIIFEADDGWPGFYCHHSHCQGKNLRDVLQVWGDADAFCAQAWRTS